MKNLLILLMALFSLSACSMFSPVKTETPTTYLINMAPYPAAHHRSEHSLLVNMPEGNPIYNSTNIAYTTHPHQIGYFVKSTWAETPTLMIQPLLIQTLQRTHYFRTVGTLSTVGQYDLILNTQLVELKQDFSTSPHLLHLVLQAELINASTNQVLGSKEFNIHELIARDDTYNGVVATNRAMSRALSQLARFSVTTLQRTAQ
jgi:cholesterol transport system auxiliary component